ncbi:hypothetical protein TSAR_013114 [Trichomalopsis sarcophagae]|uniref:Uncharacterized protein n=1 Tax=Trichomalopsis sarcophagae TaxID=543379 RepID=A0A232ERI4_9HYME|nr:hypothetical protein TSAR_013114 [Trichomalopsis sarcophagae]
MTKDPVIAKTFYRKDGSHRMIDEHEKSIAHKNCADSFFLGQNNSNAAQLLFANDNSLRNKEVTKNKKILESIVDIIKLIGIRGLGYRGNKVEAAYILEDNGVDHGNFLEILLLLPKYDSILQNHIKECINKSKMNHSLKPADIIANLVKNTIAKEINATKMFSIQIDTTQDITSKCQDSTGKCFKELVRRILESCNISIKQCVGTSTDGVANMQASRLLSMVQCQDSTGKGFKELVGRTLESYNISIKQCVGTSTDGAANMQGQYDGFTA